MAEWKLPASALEPGLVELHVRDVREDDMFVRDKKDVKTTMDASADALWEAWWKDDPRFNEYYWCCNHVRDPTQSGPYKCCEDCCNATNWKCGTCCANTWCGDCQRVWCSLGLSMFLLFVALWAVFMTPYWWALTHAPRGDGTRCNCFESNKPCFVPYTNNPEYFGATVCDTTAGSSDNFQLTMLHADTVLAKIVNFNLPTFQATIGYLVVLPLAAVLVASPVFGGTVAAGGYSPVVVDGVQTLFPAIWGPSTNFGVKDLQVTNDLKLSNVIDTAAYELALSQSDSSLNALLVSNFGQFVVNPNKNISASCLDQIRAYAHCYDDAIEKFNNGRWSVIGFGLLLTIITFTARLVRFLWAQRTTAALKLAQAASIRYSALNRWHRALRDLWNLMDFVIVKANNPGFVPPAAQVAQPQWPQAGQLPAAAAAAAAGVAVLGAAQPNLADLPGLNLAFGVGGANAAFTACETLLTSARDAAPDPPGNPGVDAAHMLTAARAAEVRRALATAQEQLARVALVCHQRANWLLALKAPARRPLQEFKHEQLAGNAPGDQKNLRENELTVEFKVKAGEDRAAAEEAANYQLAALNKARLTAARDDAKALADGFGVSLGDSPAK